MAARLIAVALRIVLAVAAATMLLSSAWLMARPQSDQLLLDAFEGVTELSPAYFLTPTERATYEGAVADTRRFTEEAERLRARASERKGAPIDDDELERVVAYQHSYEEMAQGERFVEKVLRDRAREHERFVIGVPAAMLSLICLALLKYVPRHRRRIRRAVAAAKSAPPS